MLPQLGRVEPAELQPISQDPRVHPVLRRQRRSSPSAAVSQPVPAPLGQLVVILSGAIASLTVAGMVAQQGGQLRAWLFQHAIHSGPGQCDETIVGRQT
jgi:hypothetical protein